MSSADMRLDVIKVAQEARDVGQIDEAIEILSRLLEENPHNIEAFVQILIIQLYLVGDENAARESIRTANSTLAQDDRVRLIEVDLLLRSGEVSAARTKYGENPFCSFEKHISFANERSRIAIDLAIGFFDENAELISDAALVEKNYESIVVPGLTLAFMKIAEHNQLSSVIFRLTFGFEKYTVFLRNAVGRFLVEKSEEFDQNNLAVVFSYISSQRLVSYLGAFMDSYFDVLSTNPYFVKALDLYSQENPHYADKLEMALEAMAAQSHLQSQADSHDLILKSLTKEVATRHSNVFGPVQDGFPHNRWRSDGEDNHTLMIGLFGQIRFSEETLRPLRDFILRDLEPWIAEGKKIVFAVSSWLETGQKSLADGDSSSILMQRLPPPLHYMDRQLGLSTYGDLKRTLPALISVANRPTEQILRESDLREIFGTEAVISLVSDAIFRGNVGLTVREKFPLEPHLGNQIRMWDRIAEIGRIYSYLSSRRAPGLCMLIRPDLKIMGGSFLPIIRELERCGTCERRVYVDDADGPRAIDGLGDRFILGTAAGVTACFGGLSAARKIMRDDRLRALYAHRLEAHRLLNSVLYESGATVVGVGREELSFQIYRGEIEPSVVRNALVQDAQSADTQTVREIILEMIAAL